MYTVIYIVAGTFWAFSIFIGNVRGGKMDEHLSAYRCGVYIIHGVSNLVVGTSPIRKYTEWHVIINADRHDRSIQCSCQKPALGLDYDQSIYTYMTDNIILALWKPITSGELLEGMILKSIEVRTWFCLQVLFHYEDVNLPSDFVDL